MSVAHAMTAAPGVCSFECKSDGTYLDINHISLEKTNEDPEESQYTGPVSIP